MNKLGITEQDLADLDVGDLCETFGLGAGEVRATAVAAAHDWNGASELADEFGDFETFLSWRLAKSSGAVKVLGGKA